MIDKKLKKARNKIDKIDNQIFNLIKKRTNIVNQVIKLKKSKKQIIDRKRINFILKKIKKRSIKNSIDPKITNKIWKSMIWSFIDYEKQKFKKK